MPCVSALIVPSGCFDDTVGHGGPDRGSSGTSSSGEGGDGDPPTTTSSAESTDTTAGETSDGWIDEFCIDETSLEGPECLPVFWDNPIGLDLRPSVGWPDETLIESAPCTVFAIAQGVSGIAAVFDVGLACTLPYDRSPRAFAIRVQAPLGTPMPWRMGARVELSTFVVWPPPPFSSGHDRFAVRDAETHEILVGAGTHAIYEPDAMFAPFVFERRFDVCGQPRLPDDGSTCGLPLYEGPFGIDVHGDTRDEPTLLMDTSKTVVDGTTFFVHAAQMTWSCACADVPRWSEMVLMGTAFTEPTAVDPPDCELLGFDCGAGEQCVPVRGASGAWDRTACVATGTAALGEPCSDDTDCIGGAHCSPSSTGESTCRGVCGGTIDVLECPLGQWCSIDAAGDVPPLTCLPDCDPLGDSCPEGEACYFQYGTASFQCAVEDEQPGAGEPCSDEGCAAGSVCYDSPIPNEACEYCCTALCDVDAPVCPVDHVCLAEGSVSPGHPTLGLCLPAWHERR